MLTAACTTVAAAFIGPAQLRSSSYRPLPARCSVTALEDGIWSSLALAKDVGLPDADFLDLDLLDGLILTPLLVPILGAAILRSGATAAGAKLAQLEAERSLARAEGQIKKLKAQVAERDETLVRKAAFWSDRLDKARQTAGKKPHAARPQATAAPRAPAPKVAPAAPPAAAAVGEGVPPPWRVVARLDSGMTRLRPGLTADDLVLVTGADTRAGASPMECH